MPPRRTILAALALVALALGLAPSLGAGGTGRYIVVLDSAGDPAAVAERHGREYGTDVKHVYRHALSGYSAIIPVASLAALRADEDVDYVEADGRVSTVASQVLPWGVDRVDADLSSTRAGDGREDVQDVDVYVVDSGIDVAHRDLRVVEHVNFADGPNADCFGHGTHVAGTIAAADNAVDVVGVAPGARLTAVKVTDCKGKGMRSDVIAGIDWVTANARPPAVANMSLGGKNSRAMNQAVKRSMASGVVYVVAAGNYGSDACSLSPPRMGKQSGIVSVAATDDRDEETSWSNYGPCVDLWAPGLSIQSTRLGGGLRTMSGTSMSAPHVAGAAALYLSTHGGASPAAVEAAIKATAVYPGTKSKDGRDVALLSVKTF